MSTVWMPVGPWYCDFSDGRPISSSKYASASPRSTGAGRVCGTIAGREPRAMKCFEPICSMKSATTSAYSFQARLGSRPAISTTSRLLPVGVATWNRVPGQRIDRSPLRRRTRGRATVRS